MSSRSRVLGGGWGYTIVMSGFVIWILVWTALSGWLVAVLGLAPLLLGLGHVLNNPALISAGLWATTPVGLFIISLLNGFIGALLLVTGFKNYVRFQHVMWWGILLGFAATLLILFTSPASVFAEKLNQFASAVGESSTFYQTALASAQAAGVNTAPNFSWLLTLLIAPVAWQSLQWATYSAQQNGEIKRGTVHLKIRSFIMVGALIAAGLLLALLGVALQHAAGTEGQVVASYGYWYVDPTAKIADTIILAPSMLAVAITRNPLLILLIGIGFTLNSFQIVCNCYIGVTRIMVAMSLDRLLPAWVSKVHERFHTPVNAHLVYFLLSIPIFALYSFRYGEFILFTLGVTFGCGYVFAATALSGAFLPTRAKALYRCLTRKSIQYQRFAWYSPDADRIGDFCGNDMEHGNGIRQHSRPGLDHPACGYINCRLGGIQSTRQTGRVGQRRKHAFGVCTWCSWCGLCHVYGCRVSIKTRLLCSRNLDWA